MENTCPVCENKSVFKSFGSIRREHVLCPSCGTVERHRLLYLFLQNQTDFFTTKLSVIHFSPNPGLYKLFSRQPNLQYTAVNRAPDNGKTSLEVDLTHTSFPDSCFDVGICYHVFEHIKEDRKAISEFHRILKPSGWATVQVPTHDGETIEDYRYNTPELRSQHYGQSNHVRYYGADDFTNRLKTAGFHVTILQPALLCSDDVIENYRLVRDEKIYFLRS
jgi:predicted SAM-dependent methyltransferase